MFWFVRPASTSVSSGKLAAGLVSGCQPMKGLGYEAMSLPDLLTAPRIDSTALAIRLSPDELASEA